MNAGADGMLPSLPIPSRSGYAFIGWFTRPEGGTAVRTDTVFASDAMVYAQWSRNSAGDDTPPSSGSGSGSSFGGGMNSIPRYMISASGTAGGRVTVSPQWAARGDWVTVTATPNSGYVLAGISAAGKSGEELALTERNGGYRFTMPGEGVAVSAVFQPAPAAGKESGARSLFTDVPSGAWYYDAVEFVSRNGLMNGYSDGRFAPDAPLTRGMLIQVLYQHAGKPAAGGSRSFTDVPDGSWCSGAVAWAAESGIASGYGDGRFGPNDRITREQAAAILWRYAGSPAPSGTGPVFRDAEQVGAYAREAVKWAAENGIVQGYGSGDFLPRGYASRAQAAQIFKNYVEAGFRGQGSEE